MEIYSHKTFVIMENNYILNCHAKGVHSFVIHEKDGYLKRVFYADTNHEIQNTSCLAIHSHRTDIKITVLEGCLYNKVCEPDLKGERFSVYKWDSKILNDTGKFVYLFDTKLETTEANMYKAGDTFYLASHMLHTVAVNKDEKCVWLVEESMPVMPYSPLVYSQRDLNNWTAEGLYQKTDYGTMIKYLMPYHSILLKIIGPQFNFDIKQEEIKINKDALTEFVDTYVQYRECLTKGHLFEITESFDVHPARAVSTKNINDLPIKHMIKCLRCGYVSRIIFNEYLKK
jgi:hypothetical protein